MGETPEIKKPPFPAKRWFSRSCAVYTVLVLFFSLVYLLLIAPGLERPLSQTLLGGLSVVRHGILFAVGLVCALVYTLLTFRKPQKPVRSSLPGYLRRVGVWFFSFHLMLIVIYGFYLDMLYNPYAVTEAVLLKGPSFLLSFLFLAFSLIMPFLNLLLRKGTHTIPRVILHFVLLLASIGILLELPVNGFGSPKNFLIFSVIFAAVYLIVCLVKLLLGGAKQQDENEAEDYQNVYMTEEVRRARAAEEKAGKK